MSARPTLHSGDPFALGPRILFTPNLADDPVSRTQAGHHEIRQRDLITQVLALYRPTVLALCLSKGYIFEAVLLSAHEPLSWL